MLLYRGLILDDNAGRDLVVIRSAILEAIALLMQQCGSVQVLGKVPDSLVQLTYDLHGSYHNSAL
jgi:hypothetical protein